MQRVPSGDRDKEWQPPTLSLLDAVPGSGLWKQGPRGWAEHVCGRSPVFFGSLILKFTPWWESQKYLF